MRYLVAMAFAVFAGTAQAQTSPPQAYVVDSTGAVIGLIMTTNLVLIKVDQNRAVSVNFNVGGFFLPEGSFTRYYLNSDCSGQAYYRYDPNRGDVPSTGFVAMGGKTVFYPDPSQQATNVNAYYQVRGCKLFPYTGNYAAVKAFSIPTYTHRFSLSSDSFR